MKKILHYFAAAALLAAAPLSSCNNKLNIDPVNQIPAEKALQTSTDVEAALVGAYTALGSSDLYGGGIQFLSELLGDNGELQFVGTYPYPKEFFNKALLAQNSGVARTWTEAYRAINTVNNVLANIEKVDKVKRPRIEGEAKFIRGSLYFELIKLFGKDWNDGNPQSNLGVPLVLTPTVEITSASAVPRNTVAEVYTQLLQDLTDAEAKIPATGSPFYAATKYSASGMLSRVYLQQSRFSEAAQAANRVIASGKYSLTAAFADEFAAPSSNTAEDVFAIQVTSQAGVNDLHTFFSESGRGGDVEIQQKHLDLYETGDARGKFFDKTGTYTLKFEQVYGNVKIMRLAEIYLTRAEGNFRAGTAVGATPLADINRIRARAGLKALAAVTLPQILKERHLELAFEGFTLADAKRNKVSIGALPYNSDKLVYPIPRREIDVNPNLVQNSGY